MSDKKNDLLGKILNDFHEEECAEAKELIDFIESMSKQLTRPHATNSSPQLKDHKDNNIYQRLKRTYYFRSDLINLLNLAQERCIEIKNIRKDIKSLRITKSKIVNLALELLLDDFVKNGENSFLFKKLFQKTGD